MKKRMIIMLAITGLILGGVFGFQAFKNVMIKKYMASMGGQPQTVSTIVASRQDWEPELSAVGTLRAARGVDVSTETAGIIDRINFKSGTDVKEGTLLATLRAKEDMAKLHSLEADVKLAEITFKRDSKLLKIHAVSQATVDTDKANLDRLSAQIVQQKAVLAKKMIRAPFAGHLGIRQVDIGQYIGPGTAIVTLQALDPVYLDFYLPQQSLAKVRNGQKVKVTVSSYPDTSFAGEIFAINPKVDPDTRNALVRVVLKNPDHLLLSGMYATASISIGKTRQYITLPQTSISYNPYGNTVYVVQESTRESGDNDTGKEQLTVQQRFVTLGPTRGDQVAIVEGVSAGETIVTSGQIKLQNNTPVKINNTLKPQNEANPKPSEQ